MITVIKLGGNIIDNSDQLELFLHSFSKISGKKILVHGGGKSATALSQSMGVKAEMIDGRRVTDEATLKIVTMVYAGWINKNMVTKLQSMNCNAIGLSGADGNLMQAKKRGADPIDFGFVGDLIENGIHTSLLEIFLESGLVPIIAPITHDHKGQLLNTNADTIASEIATALSKTNPVQLIYCFEKNGVLENMHNDTSVLPTLEFAKMNKLSKEGNIHSGMLPKLNAGFAAKSKGVSRVIIGNALQVESLVFENSLCTQLE